MGDRVNLNLKRNSAGSKFLREGIDAKLKKTNILPKGKREILKDGLFRDAISRFGQPVKKNTGVLDNSFERQGDQNLFDKAFAAFKSLEAHELKSGKGPRVQADTQIDITNYLEM